MNESAPAAITRTAIDGAQFLPLNLCKAASLNPRKRFKQAALDELANSIEKFGVMQPVLARPIAGAKRGAPQYEIIAGERRFRASVIVAERRKETDIALIPAVVRELSDFEALELATTENLQREDMHPLEEAEGFEGLLLHPVTGGEFTPPRIQGYSVDALAIRIGKSRGYVFARLKLLALIPAARDAFYADKISASVALLIARMPASVQADATKDVITGWGGEPLNYRSARDTLERNYMLKLSAAPFKITDETLVPGAGSCRECPKRTGANPDLFDDVKGADVCTDPPCFAGKKDAHQARLIAQATEEGREVILGDAAKKVKPHRYDDELKGYMRVDAVNYRIDANKPLSKLMGKDTPPIALLEDPHTHELVQVVRTDAAMQVLKDKGVVKSTATPTRNAAEKQAEAKAKAETTWRTTVAERAVAAIATNTFDEIDVHDWLLPEVAVAMWKRLENETEKRVERLLGWDHLGRSYDDTVAKDEQRIRGLTAAQLDQLFVAMTVAGQMPVNQFNASGKPTRLLQVAGRLGIDGAAVRAELNAAAKAKEKAKAAKAPKAKPLRGLTPAARTARPAPPSGGKGAKPKKAAAKVAAAPKKGKGTAPAEAGGKPASGRQETAKPAVQISAEAAWPFPIDGQAA